MQPLRSIVPGLLLAALPAPGWAQRVELAPSAAVECLTPVAAQRGAVEYPLAELKIGKAGRVKMQARFTAPDKPPTLEVLESEGGAEFVAAVREQMRTWRVPCLPQPAGEARLEQEYVFSPDKREIYWGAPQDKYDEVRLAQEACLVHVSGRKQPEFPRAALRDGVQGRVVTRLTFNTPDKPPLGQVHFRPDAELLGKAIKDWVTGYRLPCLSGESVALDIGFTFVFEGESYGFRPLTLRQFLPMVKGILKQKPVFDTNTMGCPFDLRFVYRQPAMKNAVGSIAQRDAARRPLLEWLAGVELDLPPKSLDAVFGDETTITVPCVKIDLSLQEKS